MIMTSILKRIFRRQVDKIKEGPKTGIHSSYTHDISEYDESYTVVRSVLRMVGLRLTREDAPSIRLCWDVFYWFEFINLFVVTGLEVTNMVLIAQGGSFEDAVEIFRMMPCVGYLLMAMTKSYKLVYHRPVYENLVMELRGMWPQKPVGEEEHGVIETALAHLKRVVQGYYWCNNVLLFIFLSPSFVEIFKVISGYNNATLILPFFYWFPFDPFQRGLYEVILVLQNWHGCITIWFLLCSDLLYCIFLSHVTTQFDLLAVRIRKLVYVPLDDQLVAGYPLGTYSKEYFSKDNTSIESFNNQDWERRHQKEIAKVVLTHHALIRLSGDVERMSSFGLLVNFVNSSIILCFCGFCAVIVEKWNELVYKSFLMTALSQTWLLCWYGQRLVDSSKGVSDALYNSGWYQASRKIKSCIIIMMHRSQKQVHVTTYGFSVVSLASYTTIIKSAWSYFTLLLNIYKK